MRLDYFTANELAVPSAYVRAEPGRSKLKLDLLQRPSARGVRIL